MTTMVVPPWWDNGLRYFLLKCVALQQAKKESPGKARERFDRTQPLFGWGASAKIVGGYCYITYRTGPVGTGQRHVAAFKMDHLREDQKEFVLERVGK